MKTTNVKVWVCMSCKIAHFSPNRNYADCLDAGQAMYVGFVWPAKGDDGD